MIFQPSTGVGLPRGTKHADDGGRPVLVVVERNPINVRGVARVARRHRESLRDVVVAMVASVNIHEAQKIII